MVPNGWSKVKFGEITEIGNGQVDPKKAPYSSMMHIGPENVVSHTGQIINIKSCKESDLISGKYEFDENAIVYSKIRPNLNKVCKPDFKGVCSADMYPIWVKNGLDKDYLFHYMLGPHFYKAAISMSMRTGMPKINRNDLNTLFILLPSIAEQNKIAQILSTWDQAILTTEKLLENSQQQKKALMQQLLTGKKRLLDEDGVRFSESWCLVKLRDVVKIDRGFAFKSDQYKEQGIRIIRVTNLESNGYIETVDCVYLDQGEVLEYQKYALREHDVLLVMVGATAGKLGFVTKQTLPALLNQNMWLLRSKDMNQFTQSFLKYLSQVFIEKYLSAQQGSARGFFTQSTFEKVTFKIPKVEEQLKIVGALDLADQEIDTLQKKLDCLKQEKKALMQQLLTGKKRVKVAA